MYPLKIRIALACLLSFGISPAIAADNAVLRWNDQVLNATRLSRNPPPVAALHLATFHAAIFDTVNGFGQRHRPWHVANPAPAGADLDAAIAGAAFTVLRALWGESSNPRNFQVALEQLLVGVPEGPARTSGLAYGKQVAEAVLSLRAQCGLGKTATATFSSSEPGKWRETPPGFRPCVTPQVGAVTPFVMRAPDQFRPPPPPAVGSRQHAEELAHVAKVGARDHAQRTEEETLSTPFWADDLGTATPAGHWNVIAQDLARRHNLSVVDCARLFALLNFATADAAISCWDAKYHYLTWRPETALRELTPTLNPYCQPQPDFIPNMMSPAHPDYTSGHSTFSAAAAHLLELYFGTDELAFTTTSDGLPGAVRSFRRLSEARDEVGLSRVFGGIHTMSANLAGQDAGIKVADWVFQNALLPAPGNPKS